jgi:phage shock protein E
MAKKIFTLSLIINFYLICSVYQVFSNQISEIIAKKSISSSELKELIDKKNNEFLLIDVRTGEEYKNGHIPTAINIPYTEIEERIKNTPKNKLIIVYCRTGRRSEIARKKLLELGYTNVINFGGIGSWDYELIK